MSKSLLHVSVPSPEVTAPFALVPSPEFCLKAPWYSLPPTTCVGLGYDLMLPGRGFHGSGAFCCFSTVVPRRHALLSVK